MLNHSGQRLVDVNGQVVKTSDSRGFSVKHCLSQLVVFTRKEHLRKSTSVTSIAYSLKSRLPSSLWLSKNLMSWAT
jgi:transcriptional regulator